jgi:hypothetical protein
MNLTRKDGLRFHLGRFSTTANQTVGTLQDQRRICINCSTEIARRRGAARHAPRQTATCPPRRRIRNPSVAPAPRFPFRLRRALTHRAALVLTAGSSLGDGATGRSVATLDLCGRRFASKDLNPITERGEKNEQASVPDVGHCGHDCRRMRIGNARPANAGATTYPPR